MIQLSFLLTPRPARDRERESARRALESGAFAEQPYMLECLKSLAGEEAQ